MKKWQCELSHLLDLKSPLLENEFFSSCVEDFLVNKYSSTMRVQVSFRIEEHSISSSRLKADRALQLSNPWKLNVPEFRERCPADTYEVQPWNTGCFFSFFIPSVPHIPPNNQSWQLHVGAFASPLCLPVLISQKACTFHPLSFIFVIWLWAWGANTKSLIVQ